MATRRSVTFAGPTAWLKETSGLPCRSSSHLLPHRATRSHLTGQPLQANPRHKTQTTDRPWTVDASARVPLRRRGPGKPPTQPLVASRFSLSLFYFLNFKNKLLQNLFLKSKPFNQATNTPHTTGVTVFFLPHKQYCYVKQIDGSK